MVCKFFENFGDFAFTMKARAVALRDFGPGLAPMNAFLDHHRHRDAACADGAAYRECTQGRGFSGPAPQSGLGVLCEPRRQPVSRAC